MQLPLALLNPVHVCTLCQCKLCTLYTSSGDHSTLFTVLTVQRLKHGTELNKIKRDFFIFVCWGGVVAGGRLLGPWRGRRLEVAACPHEIEAGGGGRRWGGGGGGGDEGGYGDEGVWLPTSTDIYQQTWRTLKTKHWSTKVIFYTKY